MSAEVGLGPCTHGGVRTCAVVPAMVGMYPFLFPSRFDSSNASSCKLPLCAGFIAAIYLSIPTPNEDKVAFLALD